MPVKSQILERISEFSATFLRVCFILFRGLVAPFFEVEDFETFKKGGRRWKMKICLPPLINLVYIVVSKDLMEDGR